MSEGLPPVQWRRSKRARRLKLALCPWRGIELVLPRNASEAQGQAFLDSRRDWMEATWAKLQARMPEAFEDRAPEELSLPSLGRSWPLVYETRRSQLREKADSLYLPGPPSSEQARRFLKPWLMTRARRLLPEWTQSVAGRTGLTFSRVQVRDQRTRWGSCSSRGTISLNFRILFHPPRVVDYLILHELCHTRHMNHGPGFRRLLASHEPEWRHLDAQLSRRTGGVPGWLGW